MEPIEATSTEMHPEMAPPTEEASYSSEDLLKVVRRQARVIEMLKVQIGNVFLANIEQAAMIEEAQSQDAQ